MRKETEHNLYKGLLILLGCWIIYGSINNFFQGELKSSDIELLNGQLLDSPSKVWSRNGSYFTLRLKDYPYDFLIINTSLDVVNRDNFVKLFNSNENVVVTLGVNKDDYIGYEPRNIEKKRLTIYSLDIIDKGEQMESVVSLNDYNYLKQKENKAALSVIIMGLGLILGPLLLKTDKYIFVWFGLLLSTTIIVYLLILKYIY